MANSSTEAAAAFAQLFPEAYLRFHRRDRKGAELGQASRAVLQHLSMAGPLTVGEAARHLQRAQSVVSEIFDGLERKGLLERRRDPRDRRRALVWLTEQGLEAMAREREVLSRSLLERSMERMTPAARKSLLVGMRALIKAADEEGPRRPEIHRD
jgi:DNA-binding MarR family transcriptional regulator